MSARSIVALLVLSFAPTTQPFDLPKFETKYYDFYTDLDAHSLFQIMTRADCMARVFRTQTNAYARPTQTRFPFVLYRRLEDFQATGAPAGSAGLYDGEKLVAFAGDYADARTWHLLQHEGFHQFAHAAISDHLPIWLDEGLAEYFGEGVFTGDDFSLGLIPEWRRQRVRQSLIDGRFMSIDRLRRLSPQEWNGQINIDNYDQVWSLAQFLMHGENGQWRGSFERYVKALSNKTSDAQAWQDSFGHALDDLEARWKSWWLALPADVTDDGSARATIATLTSFLARAAEQRQAFDSFDTFEITASQHRLKSSVANALPEALLDAAIHDAQTRIAAGATFQLTAPPSGRLAETLHCMLPDGTKWKGDFKFDDDGSVEVHTTAE